jgi:hypothetical protein
MRYRPLGLAILPLLWLTAPALAAPPRLPFPQHVSYAAGAIRPTNFGQTQQDADVVAAYQSWKSRYLVQMGTEADGHPRYRLKLGTGAGEATVSEGMGYGMLLAEQQWGNGDRFDNRAEALQVLAGMAASTLGPTSRLPLLGDWVDPNGGQYSGFSRSCL